MKRIAILDEDGTTEVAGVRYKLVPCHLTQVMCDAWHAQMLRENDTPSKDWAAMLAAAKPDLSALPVVPRPIDPESGYTILYRVGFNNALRAIGVKS